MDSSDRGNDKIPSVAWKPALTQNADATRLRVAAQAKLAAIVESSDDAIVSKSLDGIIQTWNAGAQRIFGYTPEEAIGQSIYILIPEDRRHEEPKILAQLRRGERIDHYETIRRTKDGRMIDVSVTISPLYDNDGNVVGASKIARDISMQRQVQRELKAAKEMAESASQAKDLFLSVLSHELRTPLTPVLAAVGMLEGRHDLPYDVREELRMIRRNVETEARLVDDLLDVTRISRGKIQLQLALVNAHAGLSDVVAMFQGQAEDQSIRLTQDLSATQFHLWADRGRLEQVFVNLLSNALKFTPTGGVVAVRSDNPAPGRLRIQISDTGIGIEPAVLNRLFEPFEQGEQQITRQFQGLGLGLSIARSLIELHHGTISAQSPGKGRGATFTIELATLSNARSSAAPDSSGRNDFESTRLNHMNCRVLLVEDHVDTRNIMTRLLASFGCYVRTAGSVSEALAQAKREEFDLLISDIGLPDGSGADIMGRLRSDNHPMKGIALSGFGQPEDVARSRAAGFDEHITKPVNLARLREAIQHLLLANA